MSGIAGINQPGKQDLVGRILDKISHRGRVGREMIASDDATLGVVWPGPQAESVSRFKKENAVADDAGSGHFAYARVKDGELTLLRDHLGVAFLYYGLNEEGAVCFASEVKALLEHCTDIRQVPPGHEYKGGRIEPYFELKKQKPVDETPQAVAEELLRRLVASVEKRVEMGGIVGSWLSGGLDSSTLAALASPRVNKLYTFAAGLKGAPDLEHARQVAGYIKSEHHEVIPEFDELLQALPEVIYHLESFDALLIRSSITNYLVAKMASEYVETVFSGEGGDELFAGYAYLKSIDKELLADELIDITGRLHNTALQRVDRCSSAHGTVAHVGFLDPHVVDYALRIPVEYKLFQGVEKWILRKAMEGKLPERVLTRAKAKFWEGAGVLELISDHAEKKISDGDFSRERTLPNGWVIDTKEELLYYRIFKEHFGELKDLTWMGRTKGAPRQ